MSISMQRRNYKIEYYSGTIVSINKENGFVELKINNDFIKKTVMGGDNFVFDSSGSHEFLQNAVKNDEFSVDEVVKLCFAVDRVNKIVICIDMLKI